MSIASLDFVQRDVKTPFGFTLREYGQIAARVFVQVNKDNVPVVAAGVAFFALLSIFPLISASLSIYGYFADLTDVRGMANFLQPLMPKSAWIIISDQIASVISAPDRDLSMRILLSLIFAFWTAGAGIRAILRAMNVAYGEDEKRSILVFYLTAFGMTLGLFAFIYVSLMVIIGVPAMLAFLNLDDTARILSGWLPWMLLLIVFMLGAGIVYRFGPSRRPPRKRWVVPGVLFTTITWLALSWGFGVFVRNFGQYETTYGGISAVIVLLLWFWLTAMTVIIGAELNAEMERQTIADTTRGPFRPVGLRQARMADFLTLAMRRMFPGRFPEAPSLTDQVKPVDPSAPDAPADDINPPKREAKNP
ncbi:YihY/virulence factor BrkB family protein [uncultured Algimonas sp.]|uniref:YihY/virulence factor BrkB family protein n=1 Tax=uncultured Algimonas sp. TaxID=1547920 RepID=UPI002622D9AD|nr:YihY/virulence factor BrkB family protein [uncultured Algimonas sp.]